MFGLSFKKQQENTKEFEEMAKKDKKVEVTETVSVATDTTKWVAPEADTAAVDVKAAEVKEDTKVEVKEEVCKCKSAPALKFAKVRDVKTPARANYNDAGLDFFIPNDFKETMVEVGQSILIKSGIHVNVPEGYALIAFNKSGVATKKGLTVGACVVDESYMGEVHIHLIKSARGTEDVPNKYDPNRTVCTLSPGDKIVQFILMPVNMIQPEELDFANLYEGKDANRGAGAFGSTGTK